jgi:hypothetical protein
LFSFILALSIAVSSARRGEGFAGPALGISGLLIIIPPLLGYGYGGLKLIIAGWWDPVQVGQAIIACGGIVLLSPLGFGVVRLKRYKDSLARRFPGAVRYILMLVVILSDCFGLVSFIYAAYKWIS